MKVIICFLFCFNCFARVISPTVLLDNIEKKFPKMKAEQLKIQSLRAKVRGAEGAFDSSLSSNNKKYVEGYYDTALTEWSATKPIKFMNSKIELGHRKSTGLVPVYYSEMETAGQGENFLRFQTNLLRYRSIDPKRFDLYLKKNAVAIGKVEWALNIMDIKIQANSYFWDWVVNFEKRRIYQQLVALNEARIKALRKRVKSKDLARIYLVESEQYLLNFKSKLAEVNANTRSVRNILRYFDESITIEDQPLYSLPKDELSLDVLDLSLETLVENRPELNIINLMFSLNELKIELAEQSLMPKLKLNLEHNQSQLNANQEHGDELLVGLNLEIPIERNLGQGKVSEAKVEREYIQVQKELTKRELLYSIRNLVENLKGLTRSINFGIKEVENAKKLQSAEWQKFKAGESDFFLVNTRDMNYAKAKIGLIKKYAKFQKLNYERALWQKPLVFR